jgi:hypothetical protein
MALEILREADMVLNACGRPSPPAGYRWVDLPRVIPFYWNLTVAAPSTPFQARIANTADTMFVCMGIGIPENAANGSFRIRWPDGRFFSQNPADSINDYPIGAGPSMFALDQFRFIAPGQRISVELTAGVDETLEIAFWGVLRYLLKETSDTVTERDTTCIIGYPAGSKPARVSRSDRSRMSVELMDDPMAALASIPRLKCSPNQNIMAPEFLLGNQYTPETPAGYRDDSFTFFSGPIAVVAGGTNYSNVVIIPGADDVVIKSVTPFITLTSDFFTIPTVAMRLPNGYSLTGGDMIPANLWPGGSPAFPTFRVRAGDRLIIDMADTQAAGSGTSTTVWQFDGVKRVKLTS